MIRAGIGFTIYKDYTAYIEYDCDDCDYDCSYEKAVEILKQEISELVKNDKLTFLYEGKKVPIDTDIEERQCGNIFGPEDYDGPCWDDVTIYCNIDTPKFDSEKLKVGRCPDLWASRCVVWS